MAHHGVDQPLGAYSSSSGLVASTMPSVNHRQSPARTDLGARVGGRGQDPERRASGPQTVDVARGTDPGAGLCRRWRRQRPVCGSSTPRNAVAKLSALVQA
jgi:hypothetical protein